MTQYRECGYIGDQIAMDMAERILQEVNVGEGFDLFQFDAEATNDPRFDLLEARRGIQVLIAPLSEPQVLNSYRDGVTLSLDIVVGILSQIAVGTEWRRDDEFFDCKALTHRIERWGWKCHPTYQVTMSQTPALYDREKAKQGVYLSVVKITFKLFYEKGWPPPSEEETP